MHIVGVSNPEYTGVTVATKAIVNSWIPLGIGSNALDVARQIKSQKPDLIIIGGWYASFAYLVEALKGWPIMVVWHGTYFHDEFYKSEGDYSTIMRLYELGHIHAIGYAHPGMAEYEKTVRSTRAHFIPHTFPLQPRASVKKSFNIHVVGKVSHILKNGGGQFAVAMDFYKNHKNILISRDSGALTQQRYLEMLRTKSLILHLSHLECFPNTVLEAWSMGIPCIIGPASKNLIHNPAVKPEQEFIGTLLLSSESEPLELYSKISIVHEDWERFSKETHIWFCKLSDAVIKYTTKELESVCESFTSQKIQ